MVLTESYGVDLIEAGDGGCDQPMAPANLPAVVLYHYGLLEGTGTEGDKIFLDVDRPLTRHEGVTMMVP